MFHTNSKNCHFQIKIKNSVGLVKPVTGVDGRVAFELFVLKQQ